eukprot:4795697-Prymnesium_polylepis.2
MVAKGIDAGYASKLIQFGWETITEALKHGGAPLSRTRTMSWPPSPLVHGAAREGARRCPPRDSNTASAVVGAARRVQASRA